ncbi:MAG TPA: anti-sigma factor [Rhizobiales bacterium]|nr:anti-sigma factor [Hyphomicrobiales bacterium]
MSKKLNQQDQTLASEFAMGVLEGDAKEKAAARLKTDPEFARLVEDWQQRLAPMLDEVAPVTPGPAVWDNIAAETISPAPRRQGLWGSLAFWRGFSLVSTGFATAAVAALLLVSPATAPQQDKRLVASLTATGKAPAFLARFDPATGGLVVRTALRDKKETRVAELWLIPGDGVPRSLGLLDEKGVVALAVSGKTRSLFADGGTLAVSLEPAGGSPTGAPTGPVIASGKLQFL